MTCPCRNCELRHPSCHAHCEAYKAFRKPLEAMRQEKQRNIFMDASVQGLGKKIKRRYVRK